MASTLIICCLRSFHKYLFNFVREITFMLLCNVVCCTYNLYRTEEQGAIPTAATPRRESTCCEETRLAPDYQRQSSADSSSSSCSNITTQQPHETKLYLTREQTSPSEQCADTVTNSDKSRCHVTEQRSHRTPECASNCQCQSSCNGQKQRPQSLECKRRLSSQDVGFLEVPETDSDQSNSTVVSPVISVEENQDDDTVTIHSMSQISRSPSLTSTCSLSLPQITAGPGGGKQAM